MCVCRYPGRRVTFEYVMLRGVNDSVAQATDLARLIAPLQGLVNLIPFNPVGEGGCVVARRCDIREIPAHIARFYSVGRVPVRVLV